MSAAAHKFMGWTVWCVRCDHWHNDPPHPGPVKPYRGKVTLGEGFVYAPHTPEGVTPAPNPEAPRKPLPRWEVYEDKGFHSLLRWTGPTRYDLRHETGGYGAELCRRVPPERWPFGPPEAHQPGCNMFYEGTRGGLYCDCEASAEDDTEWGIST